MAKQRIKIEKFDGASDFSLWKIRVMANLGILGLKGIINDFSLTSPLTKSDEKKTKDGDDDDDDAKYSSSKPLTKTVVDSDTVEKPEQAMNLIILNVGDTVLRKINHCTNAAEMWDTLNKDYMKTSLPNRVYLQRMFYLFKMNESKNINENVDDFLKIVAELGSLEIVVKEEVQAIRILNSLPLIYDQLKHTLKYGNKTLSVQDVVSSAKSLEREMSEQKETTRSSNTVLYTHERGMPQVRNQKGGGQGKNRSRSNSKTRVTCWFCKKEGYIKKDCFARQKNI